MSDDKPDDKPEKPADKPEPSEPKERDEPREDAAADTSEARAGDDEPAGDKFRPEDIAARVAGMGEEDELDRIAREEEKKLGERRRQQKKKGKTKLEAAASKRLAKIGEGAQVKRPGLTAEAVAPDADPLLERVARASKWIREHRSTFGGALAVALLGLGGWLGWMYWQEKRDASASELLAAGIAQEHGRVSGKEDEDEDESAAAKPLYPTFKTAAERRDAALSRYRDVQTKYAGTGAAILARLAEGSLLLDANDPKGALAAFDDVKATPLALADAEVRGRAFEGSGFAHELLAQSDEAGAAKHLDDALAAFKLLEQTDVKGLKELGMYHEARVYEAKGDKAKAIELLKSVHEKVDQPGEAHPFPYLKEVSEDRLRALDSTALPPKAPPGGLGGIGDIDPNDPAALERLQKMLEQMQKGGGVPKAPVPAGSQ